MMTTTASKIETIRLWCYQPEKHHDKVYIISLIPVGDDKFDLVGEFGRRGSKLEFFIHAEGVSEQVARRKMDKVKSLRLSHQYDVVDYFEVK